MRTFAPRHNALWFSVRSLAIAAFQPATGHSYRPASPDSVIPEPETRYGLSLARNDAFATIARSMFLACTFASAPKTAADPFDSRLHHSVRFRGRTGAISLPGTRFPRRSPALPIHPQSPLPFRSSTEPSGSKRSTGSRFGKPAPPDVRLPVTPRCVLFRFCFGSALQTRLALPGYRSVNPGTDSIINKQRAGVKRKNEPNVRFPQLFYRLFSVI
jgi:hypothetical protein